MRARYWFVVLYVVIAGAFTLTTRDPAWLWRAALIAAVLTFVLLWTGASREFTTRHRWRRMAAVAERIGARDGKPTYESRKRYNQATYQPELYIRTIRDGPAAEARQTVLGAARRVGYQPRTGDSGALESADDQFIINVTAYDANDLPDHQVYVNVSIRSTPWAGRRRPRPRVRS